MIEWSETDLMVRDAVRRFVDKEIRPHLDELETGEMSPYPIARKLFSQFGLDAMAAESVKKMLDRERAKLNGTAAAEESGEKPNGSSGFGGGAQAQAHRRRAEQPDADPGDLGHQHRDHRPLGAPAETA
ncbi:hypothetical protein A5646_01990 [Mycobacterium sp. 1245499.0]|nr:hypothetical protein A5646_01990 [Mycobacterium sp. 1245499.0]